MAGRPAHDPGRGRQAGALVGLFNPGGEANPCRNRAIDLIAAFVTGRNGIPSGEAEAWAREPGRSGERVEYFFSLHRYRVVATKL